MRRMGITEKAKDIADKGFEKAGEYSGKASGKAAELAEKAGGKATELSGTARERAPEYLDRAAEVAEKVVEVAEKVVEAAAAGVDKATGGKYHEQISAATVKVNETLDRARHSTHGTTSTPTGPDIKPATDVSGQAGAPITPSSTNPDAEKS
jgi:coenzyme F420-reducing hydrogenase alpha subunit